jgi:hypothetical protein
VDRGLLKLTATNCSAVHEKDTNIALHTDKILQLIAIDYNEPGSIPQKPSSIIIQNLHSLTRGGGTHTSKLIGISNH